MQPLSGYGMNMKMNSDRWTVNYWELQNSYIQKTDNDWIVHEIWHL